MSSTLNYCDQYFQQLNSKLSNYNFSAQSDLNGRTYYLNHENKKSSWLPPMQLWSHLDIHQLPYGWEIATDDQNKSYYINHPNKTTTYENPKQESNFRSLPEPRKIELNRDSVYGFGFVAGSEKPVIVRSVKEAGPAKDKLLPGDQILSINGQDVQKSPQDFVIQLVKSCEETLNLVVCQPRSCNVIRKSALLSAAKKAQLKDRPCRVRFSENLSVNDTSPLYSRDGTDENVNLQNLPNILKVYLENGQTKTFKYDPHTTVKDVVESLVEKLSIKSKKHFALCIEYVKTMKSNKLTVLDPEETIANIASRPGAHNLRCVFRFSYLPLDFNFINIYRDDPAAFNYLYNQSAADLLCDQLYAHASGEIALRLVALRIQQLFLMSHSNTSSQNQVSKTSIENNIKESTTSKTSSQSLIIKNNKDSVNSKLIKSSTDFFSGMMSLTNNNITNSFSDSNNSKNNKTDTFNINAEQAFNNAKKCVKQIERAYGLEAFVPLVIIRSMKKKELVKMLVHFFKMNQSQLIPSIAQQFAKVSNCDSNQESITNEIENNQKLINFTNFNKKSIDLKKIQLNEDLIKLCFLNLLSELQIFGTKVFSLKEARLSYQETEEHSINDKESINQQKNLNAHFAESQESSIWLSPKSGICHVTKNLLGQLNPLSLAKFNVIDNIFVTRFEDCYLDIALVCKNLVCADELANSIHLVMEEKDAKEFLVCLNSFYSLYCEYKKELPITWNVTNSWWTDSAPTYLGEHKVKPSFWSYSVDFNSLEENFKTVNLSIPPPKYSELVLEKSINSNQKNLFLDSNENSINFKADTNNDFSKNLFFEEKNSNDNEQSKNCEFFLKEKENLPSKFVFSQNNLNYFDDAFLLNSKKDQIKNNSSLKCFEDKNIDDGQLNLNHQSIFKYNNKGIDNFNNDLYEYDTQSNKNYLQSSLSDSDPISINTTETLTDIPMPGQLKATDSLLLLTQLENENEIISKNGLITDHFSTCDSDTDSNETSTNNDNYSNENIINLNEANSLVIEVNKEDFLKKNLTIMNDFNRMNNCDELIESNPNILVSNKDNYVNGLKSLKKFGSSFGLHSQISSEEENYVDNVYYNYLEESDCSSPKNIKNQFNENLDEIVDIIDLTVLSPPSTPENEINFKHYFGYENNSSKKVFTSYEDDHIQNINQNNSHQSSLNTKNIDDFITSVSIPAPPTSNLNNLKNIDCSNEIFFNESFINKNFIDENLKNEDLDLIIIPPPPNIETNFVKEQDEILDRFKKATEDMKKICEKIDLSSISSKYNTYSTSIPYLNRDLHSSSSGDSGYESVFINNNSQKKLNQLNNQLNNYSDKVSSNKLTERHSFDNVFSMNKKAFENQAEIGEEKITSINVKNVVENTIFHKANSCNNFEKISKVESENNLPVQSLSFINLTPKAPPRNKHSFSSNLQTNDNSNKPTFNVAKTIKNYESLSEKNIFVDSKNAINSLIESLEKYLEQEIKFELIGKNLEYNNSKETLISKSRQFVTCSKLFVKSASEGCSFQILNYLKECINLLKIIFINSQIVITNNFDLRKIFFSKLKDVATIFLLTVETVYKINQYIEEKLSKLKNNKKVGNIVNEEAASTPYMSDLMKHATSLASSLSSLMKNLKELE